MLYIWRFPQKDTSRPRLERPGHAMANLEKALLEKGYSVISFDAPGHGKSPGKISMMPFFIETGHFLKNRYGPFEAAIGLFWVAWHL